MIRDNRVRFEQYSFPVLPGLVYEKDGNERIGEILFIDDGRDRFQIYFESGMSCLDLRAWEKDPEKVRWREYSLGELKLHLCGPAGEDSKLAFVGYFHAELTDNDGRLHILPGQLRLARPTRQLDGLRCITALCELMDGLRLEHVSAESAAGA